MFKPLALLILAACIHCADAHAHQFEIPPTLGNLTTSTVDILCKSSSAGPLQLLVLDENGMTVFDQSITPAKADDFSLTWKVRGLTPDRRYDYLIRSTRGNEVDTLAASGFSTQALPEARAPVTLAFASCAFETPETAEVWRRMRLEHSDAVFMLGDTPYIDTTDLATQRARYKAFAAVPEFARLVAATSIYSTWDDHDFGRNDTDGRLEGKENSRKAFIESRPNPGAGEDDEGIYTYIRVGDVEVFLLDARWFAGTQPSEFDDTQRTLLGKAQWAWLRRALADSTAHWKVITTGMIFNSAVRPFKSDYWSHYPAELDGLFQLIGELKLEGVVLMGGDIHRQRIVRHDTTTIIGYDLIEFISSPAHSKIIELANQPHPGLLFDGGHTHVYIELRSDPNATGGPTLRSRILRSTGETLDDRTWPLTRFRTKRGG